MPFFDHYPYTNLHNVNLDWILQKVKEWGAMVEDNNQKFIDLKAANDSFKEYINGQIADFEQYVTGYLDNLDVQAEINNKLNDMLQSGTLTPYMQPYIVEGVEEWLAEHITPTTPPVDETLSISGAAADAKVTGDRIDEIGVYVDNIISMQDPPTPFKLDLTSWEIGRSINASGYESNTDYTSLSIQIECSRGDVIEYTGATVDGNGVSLIALLALYNSSRQFVRRIDWIAQKYVVDEDIKYFKVLFGRSSASAVTFTDADFSYFSMSKTAEILSDNIYDTLGLISNTPSAVVIGSISGQNKKSVNGVVYTSIEIANPDSKYKQIYIAAKDNAVAVISFLTSSLGDTAADDTPLFASGELGRRLLAAGTTQLLDIPDNCTVINITNGSLSGNIYPKFVAVPDLPFYDMLSDILSGGAGVTGIANILSPGAMIAGRDVPKNQGVRNAYKKLHQLLDIKWTPTAATMPKVANNGNYVQGTEYTGIPYSSVKEIDTYVGIDVTIETFMTAVHNPYSVLYTENIFGSGRSAIGNTYHGVNCGSYYGMVCSSFISYALGLIMPRMETDEFQFLIDEGLFEAVYDNSYTGVQLMDVISEPGHGAIISDIIRDERGVPTTIYLLESIIDLPVTNVLTPDQLQQRLASRNGRIIRPTYLYKNLTYEASPFVAVEDEVISTPYAYNDDICTIKGNKAVFRERDYIGINYHAGTYTQMVVKKGTATVTTVNITASGHLIDLTALNLTSGLYTAYLTSGSVQSEPTYFEVVKADLNTAVRTGNDLTVKFDTSYGTPKMVRLCDINGESAGYHMLTLSEQTGGRCTYNWAAVFAEQHPDDTLPSALYAKIIYSATYGNIRSNLIQV